MNETSKTTYSIVRFGNVLGSRGSVVPLFLEQIEKGNPITITHREMTRFFMTIPEASKLVIQAGAFAKGGEIFILDMGEPVKIIDLALNIIRLAGKTTDEVEIIEVGVRPGEKIHEELMSKHEIASDQVLPRTFISTNHPLKKEEVLSFVTSLFGLDGVTLKKAIVYEANQY
jgi:FlaA1/EpsC-like NDP-sugar epimerase